MMNHTPNRITQFYGEDTSLASPYKRSLSHSSEAPLKKLQKTGRQNIIKPSPARIIKSLASPQQPVQTKPGNPWKEYDEIYGILDFEGIASLAIMKKPPRTLVNIRRYPSSAAEKLVHVYGQLRHRNIVALYEVFADQEELFLLFENMPLTLDNIAHCHQYPSEQQFIAILGQILEGLVFLYDQGYGHGTLTCKNILVRRDGVVKLASDKCYEKIGPSIRKKDCSGLRTVTFMLIQKDTGPAITSNRWQDYDNLVSFVAATASESSPIELKQHSLFTKPSLVCWEESLLDLVEIAQIAIQREYKMEKF